MRRTMIYIIIFSLFLSGCTTPFFKSAEPITEREYLEFEDWTIPGTFVPKRVYVVGLGDSLTEGVGDELKKGGYFERLTAAMMEWQGVKDVQANNLAKRGRRSDQLINQLKERKTQQYVKNADIIFFTIGGNDIMKIVKRDLFNLKKTAFYDELGIFSERLDEIFGMIRALNGDAIVIAGGLYNPFSIVMDEATEFEDILYDWNYEIEVRTVLDKKSCFVPVIDLFNSNENMVYHTDFFHPNSKGYEGMANRFLVTIQQCGLFDLSDGELDM